jgi:Rad3-related DNA helicase
VTTALAHAESIAQEKKDVFRNLYVYLSGISEEFIAMQLDLKDNQSRFQIVVKIPYPSRADRWIETKRKMDGGKWYNWQTALRLVQSCGRSIRSKDDWAKTYILDSAFARFISENKLPIWFTECII